MTSVCRKLIEMHSCGGVSFIVCYDGVDDDEMAAAALMQKLK